MPVQVSPRNLLRAIEAADQSLQHARRLRREAIQEYAGRYGFHDDGIERPINLVNRFIRVMTAHLAARNPEWAVTTEIPQLRGMSEMLKVLMARSTKEMNLVDLNRLLIKDALFGCRAICRMGLKVGDDSILINGREVNLGQIYARRVDLDDWICDAAARCREELRWEGERIRVSRDQLLDSGIYDNAVIERLTILPTNNRQQRRAEDLPFDGMGNSDRYEFVEEVELFDGVLYDNGKTWKVTMPADGEYGNDFLRIDEYQGPERGPFEWLEFDQLPAILNGPSPTAQHREQSENVNDIIVKTLNQVGNTKRVLGVTKGTAKKEIDAVNEAEDGDTITLTDPKAFQMIEFGNISQELIPLTQQMMEYWNMQSGSINLLGGTGDQSETATKFQGLAANAMTVVEDTSEQLDKFHNRQAKHIAWWLLEDPRLVRRLSYKLPSGEEIPMVYDAAAREGDFADFAFDVEPRSTIRQDGAVQVRRFVELAGLGLQSAQVTMATQGLWDTGEFLKAAGDVIGVKGMNRWWKAPNMMMDAMMQQQLMPQPGQAQPDPRAQAPRPGGNMSFRSSNRQTRPVDAAMSAGSMGMPSPMTGVM